MADLTLFASVPGSRNLNGVSKSKVLANCCGKSITIFTMASISVLQADSTFRDELPKFDNSEEDENPKKKAQEKPWQTFDNITADKPDKKVTSLVTVSVDVKMTFAYLMIGISDLINKVGKLPAKDALTTLINAPWRESNIIRLMVAVTSRATHIIRNDPICREFDYISTFRQKFEELLSSKALLGPSANAISQLFLNFIKVISWYASVRIYEQGRLTLNAKTFFGIIASMDISISENEAFAVRDVLNLLHSRLKEWKSTIVVKPRKKKADVQEENQEEGEEENQEEDDEEENEDDEKEEILKEVKVKNTKKVVKKKSIKMDIALAKKSAAKKPEVDELEVEDLEVDEPIIKKPAVKKPAVKKPAKKDSTVMICDESLIKVENFNDSKNLEVHNNITVESSKDSDNLDYDSLLSSFQQ